MNKSKSVGSFDEYWRSRNSHHVPFDSPMRKQYNRHLMTWLHALSSANKTTEPTPDERKGVSLSEQVKELEQGNQKLSDRLAEINATLMVNFGPAGREKQILEGSENEHEALLKVLLSYVRTQAPTEPTRQQVAELKDNGQ